MIMHLISVITAYATGIGTRDSDSEIHPDTYNLYFVNILGYWKH